MPSPISSSVYIYLFWTLFSKLHNAIVISKKGIVLGLHVVSESANYAIIKNHSRSFDLQNPKGGSRRKSKELKRTGKKREKKTPPKKDRGYITAGNEPAEP